MDFLDPASPVHQQKLLERAIYLDRWDGPLNRAQRVLDLGGGIGRFVDPCVERGCEIVVVDADEESIRCGKRRYRGLPGVDFLCARAEALPDLGTFDLVIACELLNYVDHPAAVVGQIRKSLRPGGTFLASVEAQYGWAMALDAPAGQLEALLGDGIVSVEGDRWVRTFTPESIRALLADFSVTDLAYTHFVLSGPFEVVAGELELHALLAAEARLRAHPVLGQLGRALTLTARAPASP